MLSMPIADSPLRLPIDDLDTVIEAVGPRWERLRNQRLLLTGGTGFIGKWMLATFLHANRCFGLSANILVLSRKASLFLNEFPELKNAKEITWLNGDVRTLSPALAADCNFAIHAAADIATTTTPREILETCIQGTQQVLNAISTGCTPRRLLLLSSGAVYGRASGKTFTIPEDWMGAPNPLSPAAAYGEGKRVSELLCSISAQTHQGLEVAIARCFAFVGPHLPLDKHFAIGNFIGAAIKGSDVCVQGDGTPMRSYLYASDMAHWLWVMLFDAPSGRAYNIGGSEGLSIGELAHRVNRVIGNAGLVRILGAPSPAAAPHAYIPSIQRIANELHLTPRIDLDEAIRRTARWWAHQQTRLSHESDKS